MGAFEDAIAKDVLSAFEALPASRKPRRRADTHEWVPLSGIVLGIGPGKVKVHLTHRSRLLDARL